MSFDVSERDRKKEEARRRRRNAVQTPVLLLEEALADFSFKDRLYFCDLFP